VLHHPITPAFDTKRRGLYDSGVRPRREPRNQRRRSLICLLSMIPLVPACACPLAVGQGKQVAPTRYVWQSVARIGGHLALAYSPDGAFSADSSLLAIAEGNRVALMSLPKPHPGATVQASGPMQPPVIVHPKIPGVNQLQIQSASFVSPGRLFVLATALVHGKKKRRSIAATMEIAFQWNTAEDTLFGKTDSVGASGGFSPPRYFSQMKDLALYKNSSFELWSPVTGSPEFISIPELTHIPQLFTFSPDRQWLLLAQVQTNASPDPIVVSLRDRTIVGGLEGHHGTVLGVTFSRDSAHIATACEDGAVRIFSAPGWTLLQTLAGNQGPVHWAEFSPDGNSVVSAGQDKTARIWSVKTGRLIQTLQESNEPLLTAAFSPNGQYLAATSANHVYLWAREPVN
jgi:hypothetical protein